MAFSLGWGRGFLEGFLEEEVLQLGLEGGEPGKGKSGQGFTGGEYRRAERDEVGGACLISQALNAQLSVDFIVWELGAMEGSEQGGHDHNGKGQEGHCGGRMGETGRRLWGYPGGRSESLTQGGGGGW